MSDRLTEIEENLELLREQVAGKKKAKTLAPLEEHTRLDQQIRGLRKQIQQEEVEYWQTIAASSAQVQIAEPEAGVIVGEIVESVGQLEQQPSLPPEAMRILQEIRDKLNQPQPTAAIKAKWVLSVIPPFVGLATEGELDLEKFWQRYFPTFRKWSKAIAKK